MDFPLTAPALVRGRDREELEETSMRKSMTVTMLPIVLGAGILLSGCGGSVPLPHAWIDAPLHESSHPVAPLEIVLHGSDPSGISLIEVAVNGEVLSRRPPDDPQSPLAVSRVIWDPHQAGQFVLVARAKSQAGAWSAETSSVVTLTGADSIARQAEPLTPTSRPTATRTLTPRETLISTATPVDTSTPTEAALASVERVRISTDRVSYEGGGRCAPTEVEILVRAFHPDGIQAMVLFYRLRNAESGEETGYFTRAMNPLGNDLYSLTVNPASEIISLVGFPGSGDGILQHQAVIQTNQGDTGVRTPLLSDITVAGC
jgi:hypothetical protein